MYPRGPDVFDWLSSQWRAFTESYDRRVVIAGSAPTPMAVGAVGMLSLFGVLGYVGPIAAVSRFERPWLPMALVVMGMPLTHLVWRNGAEGLVGNVATLFDNAFYAAALALAACSTAGGFGIGLAVTYGFVVIAFPGRTYGLTAPFATVMALPLVTTLALTRPQNAVFIILVCAYVMMLVTSAWSARQRELLAAHEKLTQAVGATSRVADDSVQAALSTTLLSLGHFLHELRNYQTVVRTNLGFVEMHAALDHQAREALADALEAQEAEVQLVRATVDGLKGRARPAVDHFLIADVLGDPRHVGPAVKMSPPERPFIISGSAEHLHGVLGNLIRNAEQAGARWIHVDARLEPSGQAVKITVHDDGPGIDEAHWDKLFQPFSFTTKAAGTGLGLYLCRRYVELFGGTIAVGRGPLGGASFDIRLPGRPPEDDAS